LQLDGCIIETGLLIVIRATGANIKLFSYSLDAFFLRRYETRRLSSLPTAQVSGTIIDDHGRGDALAC
jgi:hypothetical protein